MIAITRADENGCTASREVEATPTVCVVDGDASMRDTLRRSLEAAGWEAETFATVADFFAAPPRRGARCLVIDAALASIDGFDVQRRLAVERPETSVVFTGCADVRLVVQAMKAGAVDVLAATWCDDALVLAVELALERSRDVLARHARAAVLRGCYDALTPREREVLRLVVTGLLNKQVAGELGISEITVKAHRGQVIRKMRAASLPELVRMAAALGLPTGRHPRPHVEAGLSSMPWATGGESRPGADMAEDTGYVGSATLLMAAAQRAHLPGGRVPACSI